MIQKPDPTQETLVLNMGPQHPSTHGVLRVVLHCDGEYVLDAEPVIGYGHRMHELIGEVRDHRGFYANVGRMDYGGALSFGHGHILAVERMLPDLEVPERAEYLRVITTELNRVASHLLWFGAFLLDLGAFTPILYSFDDREAILDLLEHVTGARLTFSYMRVGGVCADVDKDWCDGVLAFVKRMRDRIPMYHKLVSGNIIFRKRVEDVGLITRDMALKYGCTGPVIRGSGIPYDVRRSEPYSIYPELDFDIPTSERCDCMGRYDVRWAEIEQSLRIIEQAIAKLPEGPVMAEKVPKVIKAKGEVYQAVEAARGSLGYYIACDGSTSPYRMKIRVPSYSNLSILKELTRGILLSDLVAVMGSFDLVIPEIDR
ncbi:MAG: NADH-quinone oxidoreductase subunit NuoD [Deltaproteobacteria bacterium]|nr:MAG: NADH-quinone oxidoreductase subunit NuoD [Deltaproteobacteria bacterium]